MAEIVWFPDILRRCHEVRAGGTPPACAATVHWRGPSLPPGDSRRPFWALQESCAGSIFRNRCWPNLVVASGLVAALPEFLALRGRIAQGQRRRGMRHAHRGKYIRKLHYFFGLTHDELTNCLLTERRYFRPFNHLTPGLRGSRCDCRVLSRCACAQPSRPHLAAVTGAARVRRRGSAPAALQPAC